MTCPWGHSCHVMTLLDNIKDASPGDDMDLGEKEVKSKKAKV